MQSKSKFLCVPVLWDATRHILFFELGKTLVCETHWNNIINVQQSAGGVLLPKSAVKFERYLVGEVILIDPSRCPMMRCMTNSLLALITSERH